MGADISPTERRRPVQAQRNRQQPSSDATEAIPLGLYIHLPWCVRKCPYCDFNSHACGGPPEVRYVDSLIADLEASLPLVWGRPVQTIFFGGGTPSLFSPEAIARILREVRALLRLPPNAEITLETNPGTIEQEKFSGFREAGVNRLSLGIQSFDDAMLQRLGRIHDAVEAQQAVEMARAAGFDNINLDLMFGLPGQTLEQALADLDRAIALEPAHLSRYQLTIEPNTLFHHQPPALPDDDLIWEMQQQGNERLAAAGFRQYEVSAWSLPGRQCRHNRNYWEFGDYLGIGAGAHGKISDQGSGRITRLWKHRHPDDYMDRHDGTFVSGNETIDDTELPFEFMLNALRLTEGVDRWLFSHRTGLADSTIATTVTALIDDSLLENDATHLRATELGRRFLNEVIARFLP